MTNTENSLISAAELALIKRGDLKAFDRMMLRYQKAIYNHLYRLTRNADDAADLAQEAFFKVYKKRHLIDSDRNFRAWLYKIATNTCYDWFEKKKRRAELNFSEEGDLETFSAEIPYYRIDKAESLDLQAALSTLKPQYQTVIFLYYEQGFSYEEIAEIIRVPLGTVKTLLYRAKKSLEEKLK